MHQSSTDTNEIVATMVKEAGPWSHLKLGGNAVQKAGTMLKSTFGAATGAVGGAFKPHGIGAGAKDAFERSINKSNTTLTKRIDAADQLNLNRKKEFIGKESDKQAIMASKDKQKLRTDTDAADISDGTYNKKYSDSFDEAVSTNAKMDADIAATKKNNAIKQKAADTRATNKANKTKAAEAETAKITKAEASGDFSHLKGKAKTDAEVKFSADKKRAVDNASHQADLREQNARSQTVATAKGKGDTPAPPAPGKEDVVATSKGGDNKSSDHWTDKTENFIRQKPLATAAIGVGGLAAANMANNIIGGGSQPSVTRYG